MSGCPPPLSVVEVLSPDDETYAKFGFYGAHAVVKIVVADPEARSVRCFVRRDEGFAETPRSSVLAVKAHQLADATDWPSLP